MTHSTEQIQCANEVTNRLEKLKRDCFLNPNPYYVKGMFPTEYQDLVSKINELKKLNTVNG